MAHAGVALSLIFVLYVISVTIHRLFLSQYAKFPGPKLAALTYGYMFYYDAIAGSGQYYKKIEQLHEEYGTCCTELSFFSSCIHSDGRLPMSLALKYFDFVPTTVHPSNSSTRIIFIRMLLTMHTQRVLSFESHLMSYT